MNDSQCVWHQKFSAMNLLMESSIDELTRETQVESLVRIFLFLPSRSSAKLDSKTLSYGNIEKDFWVLSCPGLK